MKMETINFAKVREDAVIPTKNTEDAGYDIYANFPSCDMVIFPHETVMIPTGIASAFSDNYYFQIEERGSTGSIGMKKSAGVIDSGYRNEWFIPICNTNELPIVISKDAKKIETTDELIIYPYSKAICQAVLLPVPKTIVEEITYEELQKIESERGKGALGSSGK